MTKRIISIVTAILLMLQIMMVCPIELSAETPPQTTTYTGTGYTVEYTVKSSWDKTQNIGIKLNNTSDSPMSVWALKYNAHGEIRELYNGEVYKNEGTEYIIRSTSSNSSIEAGKSVEFGYSVTGENLSVPESIVLCSEQREANEAEYSVEFQLSEQWNPTYTAKIVLNNLSQFEMTGWNLSYDSNATVENIWNGKLLNQTDGRITVSGSAENFTILTGGTTEININGKVSDEAPTAENFKLTYTYINEEAENDNKEELAIFAFGNYDEETNNLEVSWYSNTEKGTYEVLKSTDNINYTAIASVTDTDSCSVAGTSLNNGTQYFKVKVTDENGRTAESIPFEVTKNENGVTSGYIDTDNDGLADYLEETLGTDLNKADTDNDELTDYEEVYITGTDPLKADTDGNGTADGSEDPDTDGLTNQKEIQLKTDPLNPDTDGDGLTDGAEVNTHGTDPLKYDTDEDKISDGDEIKIGLNPKNPATNGIPDNEYTIPQEVTADSEAMSEINTEDNPYKLSVEVKAAGNAENISVSESGYANAMHNDAILGIIPELIYDSNCKIDEVVVKFKLEEEYLPNPDSDYAKISPEFEGIKRYNVFRFFEDINMLLPVETKFNVAENTIYAETDCLGTYCVMDMEKLLESLGISAFKEAELPVPMTAANAETTNNAILPSADKNAEFSVDFVVDTRSCVAPEDFTVIKANILSVCKVLLTNSPNAEVYLLSQYGYKLDNGCEFLQNENGEIALKDAGEIETILNNLEQETVTSTTNCVLSEAIQKIYETTDHSRMTYVFDFFQPKDVRFRESNGYMTLEQLKANNIDVSVVSAIPEHKQQGYANDMYSYTNGAKITEYVQSDDKMVEHIYRRVPAKELRAVIATGYRYIELKGPLNAHSALDSDSDGLRDWEEVKTELVNVNDDGSVGLLTFGDYQDMLGKDLFYVKDALYRFRLDHVGMPNGNPIAAIEYLKDKFVLPINSDPTKEDSDGDGFMDCVSGKFKSTGYYTDTADKWPLTSKPKPEFYQKDGNYYFNIVTFSETSIGNRTKFDEKIGTIVPKIYPQSTLNLNEEDQKYIYNLCEVAKNNDSTNLIDPLLVFSICAHETGCKDIYVDNKSEEELNKDSAAGIMQVILKYVPAYCKSEKYEGYSFYNNSPGLKRIFSYALDEGKIENSDYSALCKVTLDNITSIAHIVLKRNVSLTFGVALLYYKTNNPKADSGYFKGLQRYCSTKDNHSPKEDALYRDTLATLIEEELIFEEQTKGYSYSIVINGIDVKL